MPMTMSELKSRLSEIEPTESMYNGIGPSEVPLLKELLKEEEPWLAARAVYVLSRINAREAHAAVAEAARDPRPELRVAAAVNAPVLPPDLSDRILDPLLADDNVGVRKFAIKAVSSKNNPKLTSKLESLVTSDPDVTLRGVARERLRNLKTHG
jgi:HEAT repeat protein